MLAANRRVRGSIYDPVFKAKLLEDKKGLIVGVANEHI